VAYKLLWPLIFVMLYLLHAASVTISHRLPLVAKYNQIMLYISKSSATAEGPRCDRATRYVSKFVLCFTSYGS